MQGLGRATQNPGTLRGSVLAFFLLTYAVSWTAFAAAVHVATAPPPSALAGFSGSILIIGVFAPGQQRQCAGGRIIQPLHFFMVGGEYPRLCGGIEADGLVAERASQFFNASGTADQAHLPLGDGRSDRLRRGIAKGQPVEHDIGIQHQRRTR